MVSHISLKTIHSYNYFKFNTHCVKWQLLASLMYKAFSFLLKRYTVYTAMSFMNTCHL